MAATLVRIFFDDNQICGVVIADDDAELDQHHKSLIVAPHKYVDVSVETYKNFSTHDGLPNIIELHPLIKDHPDARIAQ